MSKKNNTNKEKIFTNKIFWSLVLIGVLILVFLILLSSIIQLGERIRQIHEYVEYTFYIISFLLVFFLIIRPLLIIFLSPSFSIETTLEKHTKKNYHLYKIVSKRLLKKDYITDENKDNILNSIKNKDELFLVLQDVYNQDVKENINAIIQQHAEQVMLSTAISQNGRFDFISTLIINIRMIKEIVTICGFRPNLKNLAKLMLNVFTTALVAEGLEDIDINQLLPSSFLTALKDIPFVKSLMSSAIQGISNCLLTLRVGIITRNYLFNDAKLDTKNKIRKYALLEASKYLPLCIGNVFISTPKKIFSIFKNNKKEKEILLNEPIREK